MVRNSQPWWWGLWNEEQPALSVGSELWGVWQVLLGTQVELAGHFCVSGYWEDEMSFAKRCRLSSGMLLLWRHVQNHGDGAAGISPGDTGTRCGTPATGHQPIVPCCTGSPHRTFRVQCVLCHPPFSHRRKVGRKGVSGFHPPLLPLLRDVLDTCQLVTGCPQEIFTSCFFCLDLQRPHFSWIKYELFSWSPKGGNHCQLVWPLLFIAVVADASALAGRETRDARKQLQGLVYDCFQCELCRLEPMLRNR